MHGDFITKLMQNPYSLSRLKNPSNLPQIFMKITYVIQLIMGIMKLGSDSTCMNNQLSKSVLNYERTKLKLQGKWRMRFKEKYRASYLANSMKIFKSFVVELLLSLETRLSLSLSLKCYNLVPKAHFRPDQHKVYLKVN